MLLPLPPLSLLPGYPNLASFPTRRSSDLLSERGRFAAAGRHSEGKDHRQFIENDGGVFDEHRVRKIGLGRQRSEEHTSELQSLTNLVCRLLLEKKNTARRG